MKLEFLPTEILFDIFDYLNGTDLLRAFYGLNSRFNHVLHKQYSFYRFRFNSISKCDFDQICQQYLPNIVDQVIALDLTDYEDTPQQIDLFFSYIPSVRSFTHLRSLCVSHLRTYPLLLKVLDECQHLPCLTQLELYSCSLQNSSVDFQIVIDKIWSLSTLTSGVFYFHIQGKQIFCLPTVTNSSLKSLAIYNPDLEWNQIHPLITHTPRLKSLLVYIKHFPTNLNHPDVKLSTLTKYNICIWNEIIESNSDIIFQAMPNLRCLKVTLWSQLIDGYKWEQIIRDYLPKLKTFDLKMKKMFFSAQNIQQKVTELINSFRTPFWVDEQKWFVRCFTEEETIHLNTISNASNHYNILVDSWQSTCPDDNQQEFYNHITDIYNTEVFNRPVSSAIQLPNITTLYIKLPINDQFRSVVPNLNRLERLSISSYSDIYQSQLQTLLDQAPHIITLRLRQDQSIPLPMSLFKIRHKAICHIDLSSYKHYFSEHDCLLLTQSSLGVQCEVLSILVTNHQCIIRLTENMSNLRSLTVKCMDTQYDKQCLLSEEQDKIILWLKERLPSTYVIVRDSKDNNSIIIWK